VLHVFPIANFSFREPGNSNCARSLIATGGGHTAFRDSGYDCSGTVSYALGGAGLISSPMSSSDFRRYGQGGQERWITIYTRNGHTFAVIAGLRLDTTPGDSWRYRWAPP
jgi:hypothetical protein